MLLATEATLMIEPPPCASMPGSTARISRYIDFTFRLNEKSQSLSSQSRMLPACTKPAPLNSTSMAGSVPTRDWMAAASVTSSLRVVTPGVSPSVDNSASLTSVAMTLAPCSAKANAVARPMPWPAAVTRAVLPARRWLIGLLRMLSGKSCGLARCHALDEGGVGAVVGPARGEARMRVVKVMRHGIARGLRRSAGDGVDHGTVLGDGDAP